jgi:cob(I)alamin adenosyltransferase
LNHKSRGLVTVFTGNGKGKTSAALGIALRALGHGLKVRIIFFMKGDSLYGEDKTLEKLTNISLERFGLPGFCDPENITEEHRAAAGRALQAAREALSRGEYDVVVLDEVNVASAWGLIPVEEVLELVRNKLPQVDLVLTGRYADARLIDSADIVTEMVEVKHPFPKGAKARRGVDY